MDPQTGMTSRPAREADDLDELNEGNSAWMGASMMRQLFAATEAPCGALIAEVVGEAVGYADYAAIPVLDGHRAPASVYVHPSQRGRGAGKLLWTRVLEMITPDLVRGVIVSSDADDAQSRAIALAHGFRTGGIHIESELDLRGMNVAEMRQRSAPPPGLTLDPLPANADERCWRDFAIVFAQLESDTPDRAAGSEPTPFSVIRTFLAEPWQVMAAWDGSNIVGFTAVSVRNDIARALNTHLTGVLPEYRRLGVATALKAAHGLALRQAGWRTITTQNMDGNAPMLASNRTLGFRQVRRMQDLIYDFAGIASAGPPSVRVR